MKKPTELVGVDSTDTGRSNTMNRVSFPPFNREVGKEILEVWVNESGYGIITADYYGCMSAFVFGKRCSEEFREFLHDRHKKIGYS